MKLAIFAFVGVFAIFNVSSYEPGITYRSQASFQSERSISAVVTAYSSTPDQTDDTPRITASGFHVKHGVIANNCLPFHTQVKIGGQEYTVLDRMNSRYGCNHFDVWMPSREHAINWGKKRLRVILKNDVVAWNQKK